MINMAETKSAHLRLGTRGSLLARTQSGIVARMLEQGHDVVYYENTEGGHAGAANNNEIATMRALAYTFMLKELF